MNSDGFVVPDRSSSAHSKTIYDVLGREPVHPFPARMAPGIALEVLSRTQKPKRVLDPMMGSGTVLALARAQGHYAVGVDVDPLAVLIARVWTTAIDRAEVPAVATSVLADAHHIFRAMLVRDAYPKMADDETKAFVRYWFDAYSRRQLAALALAIDNVQNDAARDVLWCAYSRLIITKQAGASLAMDLSHSRPHKVFDTAPIKPFNKFLAGVERVVTNCIDTAQRDRGPAVSTHEGDARALPFARESIDLVLTSPPYLNAIDYIRCSKFSLVWMGHAISRLRQVRSESVGTEAGSKYPGTRLTAEILANLELTSTLASREHRILARYINDMTVAVREAQRVLVKGGVAVYVVGENTVRGTYIRNSQIVVEVAKAANLHLVERRVRELPGNRRYLPPPTDNAASAALDARMRREVILTFEKRS